MPVKDALNKFNSNENTTSILRFDFSTLYRVPCHNLLKVLDELIDFRSKGRDGRFISVDGRLANWAKEIRSGVAILY